MQRLLFFIFFASCFTFSLISVAQFSIGGTVKDSAGNTVTAANVLLIRAGDTSLVKMQMTGEDGSYMLEPVSEGTYRIKIVATGYDPYLSEEVIVNGAVTLPIVVAGEAGALEEVTISGKKRLLEMKSGMLVVNVENSIISAGASALEVLERSPGVVVDQGNNIRLKGRPGVQIWMDGKPMPATGDQLVNILRSIPSASIARIEIISNPSARYDAAGTGGIINIVTKKTKGQGMYATANASYAQGVYPKFSAGTTVSYRNKGWKAYAGYNYSYRKGFIQMPLWRTFYEQKQPVLSYEQQYFTVVPSSTHTGNLGLEYTISPASVVGFSASGNATAICPEGDYYSKVLDGTGNLQSSFITNNRSRDNWNNYALNANLRHNFDTVGAVLTVDIDYARYWNQTNQNFITRYFTPSGEEYQQPYLLYGDLSGTTQIRSVKADHVRPLAKGIKLEAGIKTSFVTADNKPQFFDQSNGGMIYDTSKSNHFIYNENINAAYVNVNKEEGKWTYQLGLRAENTSVRGEQKIKMQTFTQNYTQLFPNIAVQRQINDDHNIGLTIGRRIERPAYSQLNPFRQFLDPTEYDEGNPYLRPVFNYVIELSHVYKGRFITTPSYIYIDRPIMEVVKQDADNDKVTAQQNINLGHTVYYALSGTYSFTPVKWWECMVNFNGYNIRYRGNFNNTPLDRTTTSFDVNTLNSFTLPLNLSGELRFSYNAPFVYAYMDMKAMWSLDMGLQRKLMKDKLVVRINATDIFRKSVYRGTSFYTNYTQTFITTRDSRRISLALVYNFGSSSASFKRRAGGAEEEKNRTGSKAGS